MLSYNCLIVKCFNTLINNFSSPLLAIRSNNLSNYFMQIIMFNKFNRIFAFNCPVLGTAINIAHASKLLDIKLIDFKSLYTPAVNEYVIKFNYSQKST